MSPDQVEEIKWHFGVVTEALRSDIRQIAQGHSAILHELQEMWAEVRAGFKEVQSLMRLSFAQLDQHIRMLESDRSI